MKYIIFIFLSFSNNIYADAIIRHQDLEEIIQKQNDEVQISQQLLNAEGENLYHFKKSFLPKLDIYSGYEYFKKGVAKTKSQPQYGASLTMNIFNGGRDKLQDQILNISHQQTKFQHKIKTQENLLKANQVFWNSIYLKEMINLIKTQKNEQDKNLASINERISGGVALQSDKIDYEINQLELERQIQTLTLLLKNEMSALKIILGFEDDLLRLEEILTHQHQWEKEISITKIFDKYIVGTTLAIRENELRIRKSERFFWPTIELYGQFNQFNEREEDYPRRRDRSDVAFGIKLSMNIFDGMSFRQEARVKGHEREALKFNQNLIKKEWNTFFENKIYQLKDIHHYYHLMEEKIKKAYTFHQMIELEYARGVRNSSDMILAKERLLNARSEQLKTLRDFQIVKNEIIIANKL